MTERLYVEANYTYSTLLLVSQANKSSHRFASDVGMYVGLHYAVAVLAAGVLRLYLKPVKCIRFGPRSGQLHYLMQSGPTHV